MVDTCPNDQNDWDDEISEFSHSWWDWDTWKKFRKWVRHYLNFQKSHWDEDWGWRRTDPTYEFPKMLNSSFLLAYAITTESRIWGGETIKISPLLGPSPPSEDPYSDANLDRIPSQLVVKSLNGIWHIFVRSGEKYLIHLYKDTNDPWGWWIDENVTLSRTNPGYAPLFTGEVVLLNGPENQMKLIGLSRSFGKLVDFEQSSVGISGNWTANIINPSDDVSASPSGVLKESNGNVRIFAQNWEGELIVYTWDGAWSKEVITSLPGIEPLTRITGDPVVVKQNNVIHVFALRSRDLLHFQWSQSQGWQVKNLTEGLEDEFGIEHTFQEDDIKILNTTGGFDVYGTNSQHELIRYYLKRKWCICSLHWTAQNITKYSNIGDEYKIGFGLFPITYSSNVKHIYGRNFDRDLIHYFKDGIGQWTAENVTMDVIGRYGARIAGNPIVYNTIRSKQMVFAQASLRNNLLYYYFNPDGDLWFNFPVIDLNLNSSDEPEYHISGSPVFIEIDPILNLLLETLPTSERYETDKHIFSLDVSRDYIVHFFSKGPHAWHSCKDYYRWASGDRGGFRYEPENSDDGGTIAQAYWGAQTDRVEMECPAFDTDFSPGSRAAAMLHEATHIIMDLKHKKVGGIKKDEWYHHLLGEIPFDALDADNDDHKHSSYQVQVEYLADLAEFAENWVPLQISIDAKDEANLYLSYHFTNIVGWIVGEPRPFL